MTKSNGRNNLRSMNHTSVIFKFGAEKSYYFEEMGVKYSILIMMDMYRINNKLERKECTNIVNDVCRLV